MTDHQQETAWDALREEVAQLVVLSTQRTEEMAHVAQATQKRLEGLDEREAERARQLRDHLQQAFERQLASEQQGWQETAQPLLALGKGLPWQFALSVIAAAVMAGALVAYGLNVVWQDRHRQTVEVQHQATRQMAAFGSS